MYDLECLWIIPRNTEDLYESLWDDQYNCK